MLLTNGVTITIDHALLANLFHLLDEGRDFYLSYYDSFHNLHFDRITIYQSIFGPLTTEHTVCLQKNIIPALKLTYLILSYNIVLQQIRNLVSQVSIFVLHYLHVTYEFTLFYHKHMFVARSTTSLASLPYGAKLTVILTSSRLIAQGSNLNPIPNHLTKPPSLRSLVNNEGFPPYDGRTLTMMRVTFHKKHN